MAAPSAVTRRSEKAGIRKVAILVLTMGDEIGAATLRELAPDDVEAVMDEISRLEEIPTEERQQVVHDLLRGITEDHGIRAGGLSAAKRLMEKAFGAEESRRYTTEAQQRLERIRANDEMDAKQLARVVSQEHPQAIALYLTRLSGKQRAMILDALPIELRVQVAGRFASLRQIPSEIADQVGETIQQKLQNTAGKQKQPFRGVEAMAELCNHLPRAAADELLSRLAEDSSDLTDEIRDEMFTFEDILKLDTPAITAITERVERSVLALALKGTSEEMRSHMMQPLSQRAKAMLRDEIDTLGPVRIRDVQEAQREVIGVVRELEDEGVVSLSGGESERYVT